MEEILKEIEQSIHYERRHLIVKLRKRIADNRADLALHQAITLARIFDANEVTDHIKEVNGIYNVNY